MFISFNIVFNIVIFVENLQFITGSGGSIIDDQNKDNMKTSENKRRKPDIKQFGLTKSKNTLTVIFVNNNYRF